MRRLLTRWPPRFLRTPEAARFLGLSARTLEKHRSYGTGPKYRKVGGRIIYALSDLKAWADIGIKKSTSDPGLGTVLPAKPILAAGCTHPAPRKLCQPGSTSPNGSGSRSAKRSKESSGPCCGKPDHNGERSNCSRSYDDVETAAVGDLECVRERADRVLSSGADSEPGGQRSRDRDAT
jgi:predicted DNA-binding transcriptional regulator AlpA